MKRRITFSLIALSLAVSGAHTAQADNPFEKLIPRGKLIKTIIGQRSDDTVVLPGHGNANHVPTPAQQAISSPDTQPFSTRLTRPVSPVTVAGSSSKSPVRSGSQSRALGKTAAKKTVGFGMELQQAQNGDLVVKRIDPRGNAQLAGVSAGDVLKKIGGAAVTSVDEFNQLTQGMSDGDHMQFDLVRRGRKQQALVPFGNVDEAVTTAIAETASSVVGGAKAAATAKLDDVVAGSGRQIRSVLTSPIQSSVQQATSQAIEKISASKSNGVRSFNQVIDNQRQRFQRMKDELNIFRNSNTVTNSQNKGWKFPTFKKN